MTLADFVDQGRSIAHLHLDGTIQETEALSRIRKLMETLITTNTTTPAPPGTWVGEAAIDLLADPVGREFSRLWSLLLSDE